MSAWSPSLLSPRLIGLPILQPRPTPCVGLLSSTVMVFTQRRRILNRRPVSARPRPSSPSSRFTSGASPDNPIYVVPRATLTGWAAIAKATDDFDKEEMEGYKNDIDTLLVFVRYLASIYTPF